ncbi:MAG: response regulator [Myxococcota bacterium]
MHEDTLRVLLVEDSAPLAELVRTWLADLGEPTMHVHHVTRLEVALEHLNVAEVDALVLDLGLPDSSGLETLRRVLDEAPHVPVLVLTGESDPEAAVGAVRLGARDYLLKAHMDDATLRRAIVDAVSRHGRRPAPPEPATRIDGLRDSMERHLEDPSAEPFQQLVTKYVEIFSADARGALGGQERAESLASLAVSLRRLGAGSGDVVVLHEQALKHLDSAVAHLGDPKARHLLLLELMGRLVTAYRAG